MAAGGFTDEEWEGASLLEDPLSLNDLLGLDASLSHESLCRLIEEGGNQRTRFIWVMSGRGEPADGISGFLPESFSFVLDKKLCSYLSAFHILSEEKRHTLPTKTSILWNCKKFREADYRTLKKYTILGQDGSRSFVPDVGSMRGNKDSVD